MDKYQSIPIPVEAIQYERGRDLQILLWGSEKGYRIRHWAAQPDVLLISTGNAIAGQSCSYHLCVGEWLIWDDRLQEFTVMAKDVFDCTYVKVIDG